MPPKVAGRKTLSPKIPRKRRVLSKNLSSSHVDDESNVSSTSNLVLPPPWASFRVKSTLSRTGVRYVRGRELAEHYEGIARAVEALKEFEATSAAAGVPVAHTRHDWQHPPTLKLVESSSSSSDTERESYSKLGSPAPLRSTVSAGGMPFFLRKRVLRVNARYEAIRSLSHKFAVKAAPLSNSGSDRDESDLPLTAEEHDVEIEDEPLPDDPRQGFSRSFLNSATRVLERERDRKLGEAGNVIFVDQATAAARNLALMRRQCRAMREAGSRAVHFAIETQQWDVSPEVSISDSDDSLQELLDRGDGSGSGAGRDSESDNELAPTPTAAKLLPQPSKTALGTTKTVVTAAP